MKIRKKLLSLLLLSAIAIISFSVPVKANQEALVDNEQVQIFIDGIESREGRTIQQSDLIEYSVEENGVITLLIANGEDFSMYRSLSNEEMKTMKPSEETRGILKTIWGFIKAVFRGGSIVCQMVQYGTGENMCAKVGLALLKSMVPNVRYKAISYLVKDPNCQPQNSQQCNMPPYAYWKTTVTRA